MTHRRTEARILHVAASSLLLGCSSTNFNQAIPDESSAGATGRSATQAGAGTVPSGGSGALSSSSAGTSTAVSGGASAGASATASGGATSPTTGGSSDRTTSPGQGGVTTSVANGGAGGSAPMSNVAGAAGSLSSTGAGCDPTACEATANACQAGICQNGTCTLVNRDADTSCEGTRVCSGTGFCADCVPTRGKCDGRIPSVCSAEGHWVAGSACGLGDQCRSGACISPHVGWALSANGTANAEFEDLAFLGSDSIVAALHAASGSVRVDTKVYDSESQSETNVALGVSRLSGQIAWDLPVRSTSWASGSKLGVASDTSFIHGFKFRGTIDSFTNPNESGDGAFIRGYNAARAVQLTEVFNPLDASSGPAVRGLDAIVAQPNGAFVLLTYDEGLRYGINANPGYATLTESNTDCATVLLRLSAGGDPTWSKQFEWCTSNNTKVLKLGPNGDLYVAGSGCNQNGFGPLPVLGSTTLKSEHSAVIARLRATDGGVVKVVEFEGVSSSYGRVDDFGFLPDGSVVALVSAAYYMTIKIGATEVPGGTYFVKLDSNLDLVSYQYLGTAIAQDAHVTATRLAVAPNGVLYVAGTFVGDFDFGGGTFPYYGSCERCPLGDAFIASFGSDLSHRWSRSISSASYDNITALLAENGRAYVSAMYGATVMVDGTAYAPTASGARAGTLFAFVE